jgi:hypothetical protein
MSYKEQKILDRRLREPDFELTKPITARVQTSNLLGIPAYSKEQERRTTPKNKEKDYTKHKA